MGEIAVLELVPLFKGFPLSVLAKLGNNMKRRSYLGGETIFHQGDPGSLLYVITSGQVKIVTTSPKGEEVILAVFTGGDFFGELSLLDQEPRSASAVAMVATETLILHHDDFINFLRVDPDLSISMLAALSRRLRRTNLFVEDACFLDLPARLAKRLLELSQRHGVRRGKGLEIDLPLTQKDLAAMVGASRVAVNKQLNLFQAQGIIDMAKRRITILRPDKLKEHIY